MPRQPSVRIFGRYELYDEIAVGGMASVHLARLAGPEGFTRTVAIKRLHKHYAGDPAFTAMLLDEARLVSRIRHPNVVPTLDVVAANGELLLVMEYVAGESLARILRPETHPRVSLEVISSIMVGVLQGLHAAHEARDERGASLGLVHRDVSPQNILVGIDGISRILDFGIAKAAGRSHTTRDGTVKGKLAYMAPEQLEEAAIDRRTDIHAAGVVLWEMLTRRPLFGGSDTEAVVVRRVLEHKVGRPSALVDGLPLGADEVILRALDRDPMQRFGTAREMALAIEGCFGHASPTQVGEWVESRVGEVIRARASRLAEIERDAHPGPRPNPNAATAEAVSHSTESTLATSSAAVPPGLRRRGGTLSIVGALAVGAVAVTAILVPKLRHVHAVAPPSEATSAPPAAPAPPPVEAPGPPAAPEASTSAPASTLSITVPTTRSSLKPISPRTHAGRTSAPLPVPTAEATPSASVPCTKRRWVADESGILHPVPDCP